MYFHSPWRSITNSQTSVCEFSTSVDHVADPGRIRAASHPLHLFFCLLDFLLLFYFISPTIFLMDPLRELGRTLLVLGAFLVLIGALLYFGGKLPLRLGRLPGDIVHRGEHTTFYFPIVTCLLLSIGSRLLFWLFAHFRK